LRITFSVNTRMARSFQQAYYVCKIPRYGGYTQAKHQETEIKKIVIKSHSCQLKIHDGESDIAAVKKRIA